MFRVKGCRAPAVFATKRMRGSAGLVKKSVRDLRFRRGVWGGDHGSAATTAGVSSRSESSLAEMPMMKLGATV